MTPDKTVPRYGRSAHPGPPRINLDIPDRITNANQREVYRTPQWQIRDGADQFLRHKSRGNPT